MVECRQRGALFPRSDNTKRFGDIRYTSNSNSNSYKNKSNATMQQLAMIVVRTMLFCYEYGKNKETESSWRSRDSVLVESAVDRISDGGQLYLSETFGIWSGRHSEFIQVSCICFRDCSVRPAKSKGIPLDYNRGCRPHAVYIGRLQWHCS